MPAMAWRPRLLSCLFLPLSLASAARAATVGHNWVISYQFVLSNCVRKLAVTINGQTPGPSIRATEGDTVVVVVKNSLPTENTAIHWHGIRQIGTPWADGTEGVTQCPILPGDTFTYTFVVDRPGAYLYQAHYYGMQLSGVLNGKIVVAPRLGSMDAEPFRYDGEHAALLNDFWHKSTYDQSAGLASVPIGWVGEPQPAGAPYQGPREVRQLLDHDRRGLQRHTSGVCHAGVRRHFLADLTRPGHPFLRASRVEACVPWTTDMLETESDYHSRAVIALDIRENPWPNLTRDHVRAAFADWLHVPEHDVDASFLVPPKAFLVRFADPQCRDQALLRNGAIDLGVAKLRVLPWNRMANAQVMQLPYKVRVCIEGLPPHARQPATVKLLFSPDTLIEDIVHDYRSDAEAACCCVTAWTSSPNAIAKEGALHIHIEELQHRPQQAPGHSHFPAAKFYDDRRPSGEPVDVLSYEVIIHLDDVLDFTPPESATDEWPKRHRYLWWLGKRDDYARPVWLRRALHGRLGPHDQGRNRNRCRRHQAPRFSSSRQAAQLCAPQGSDFTDAKVNIFDAQSLRDTAKTLPSDPFRGCSPTAGFNPGDAWEAEMLTFITRTIPRGEGSSSGPQHAADVLDEDSELTHLPAGLLE